MARTFLAASLLIAAAVSSQGAKAENDPSRYAHQVEAAAVAAESAEAAKDQAVPSQASSEILPASSDTARLAVPLPPVRPVELRGSIDAAAAATPAPAEALPVAVPVLATEVPKELKVKLVSVPQPPIRPEGLGEVHEAAATAEASAEPIPDVAATALEVAALTVPDLPEEAPAATPSILRAERLAAISRGSSGIRALIATHATQMGIPVSLADAVVRVESRYNPSARNGPYMGLTQINHRTARALGYMGEPVGLLDPAVNLRYGMKYLAEAYKLAGGDTCRTIMKYQNGHRATSMTAANRKYCAMVRTYVGSAN